MIKLAYLVVTSIGLLIAYALFVLVGQGGDVPANVVATPQTETLALPEPDPTRRPVMGDTILSTQSGQTYTLVLFRAGDDGETLLITDPETLEDTRASLTMAIADVGDPVVPATLTDIADGGLVAALFRNDVLQWAIPCTATPCSGDTVSGIPQDAFPALIHDADFTDHAEYSQFIETLAQDSNFQLLDLRPEPPLPKPERAQTLTLSLPTIIRPTTQPLDKTTHAAVVSALLADLLPEGANVADVTLSDPSLAYVIDRDSSRPVTANGSPVSLPTHLFYTTDIVVSGVTTLPDDVLVNLGEQTRLQADWSEDAESLLGNLGLPCADCYTVTPPYAVREDAEIMDQSQPVYSVRYYDLREAP